MSLCAPAAGLSSVHTALWQSTIDSVGGSNSGLTFGDVLQKLTDFNVRCARFTVSNGCVTQLLKGVALLRGIVG